MAKVLIHCPLNISRTLVQMVGEFSQQLQQQSDISIEVITQPHRVEEQSLFKGFVERGELPDLTIGHVDDFSDLPAGFLEQRVMPLPGRFPLRRELADLGFADESGYFHPFVVIPFAVFYNQNLLAKVDLPQSWGDLLDPRWEKKILMPDEYRLASIVVRACLKADYPQEFSHFEDNFVCSGSPLEVVTAVDAGEYTLGITNIAFARISKEKNTRIIWPQDGLFCMPQVMVWSREAPKPLLELGDFLMSEPVQKYLAMQSFVAAAPQVDLHPLVAENHCHLQWKGWPEFMKIIKGRHN